MALSCAQTTIKIPQSTTITIISHSSYKNSNNNNHFQIATKMSEDVGSACIFIILFDAFCCGQFHIPSVFSHFALYLHSEQPHQRRSQFYFLLRSNPLTLCREERIFSGKRLKEALLDSSERKDKCATKCQTSITRKPPVESGLFGSGTAVGRRRHDAT